MANSEAYENGKRMATHAHQLTTGESDMSSLDTGTRVGAIVANAVMAENYNGRGIEPYTGVIAARAAEIAIEAYKIEVSITSDNELERDNMIEGEQ